MQIHRMCRYPGDRRHIDLVEVAEKPGAKPAATISQPMRLGPLPGSNESAADEGPADGHVRNPLERAAPADAHPLQRPPRPRRRPIRRGRAATPSCVQPTRAASASPESAPWDEATRWNRMDTRPRRPPHRGRGQYDGGRRGIVANCSATVSPSRSGKWMSSRTIRPEDGDSTQRRRSIGRFTDDVEALGLEQRLGPTGRPVGRRR